MEKLQAQPVFQVIHVPADRALGDMKLLGRRGKAQAPRSRFKGPQRVERRQVPIWHGSR